MSLKFQVLDNLAPRNDWCHQDSAASNKRCCEKLYNPWWPILQKFYNSWWPILQKFCNFWRPILIAEILQSLMNQAAKIQSMMTYTADILSPWWPILSARIYVASDYPGCINSAISDDPFRRNSTIPDDPYCKNSATSGDPYSLQKFCSRWWTRLPKYKPWWPILQIFWTPDDPYSVQKLCSLWLPRLHKFYNQWWPNRAQKLCNPCKPILL